MQYFLFPADFPCSSFFLKCCNALLCSDLSRPICEAQNPGSESAAIFGATLIFYVSLPFMIHLLLNTFVFGLAPASVDKKSTDEDVERGVNVRSGKTWRGKSVMAQSKSSRVTATLVDAYSSHGENDSDEVDRTFMLYGYPVRLPKCCACRIQVIGQGLHSTP